MDPLNLAFIVVIIIFLIGSIKRAIELKDAPDEDDEKNIAPIQMLSPEEKLEAPEGYLIYQGSQLNLSRSEVHEVLLRYYSYYTTLLPHLQTKFLIRIMRFMDLKIFILPKEKHFREMPVLSSAAAIQLTFGLDHFLLPWFQFIWIKEEAYFAQNSFRVLAGHVEGNTINIAWNHLMNGFSNNTDGKNTCIHEMAHALWYQNVIAGQGNADKFRQHFDEVMNEGQVIYQEKKGEAKLFSDYAYRNLQELWAESIELIFEKPEALKTVHPNLFLCLSELINQNPAQKENPVLS